LRVANCTT